MSDRYALTDDAIERIRAAAAGAEYAIVAASNGLDMTDGLDIFRPNEHFMRRYGDFYRSFGLTSILQGLSARWPSAEARWAFLARVAQVEWLGYEPTDTMRRVLSLVLDKPYFAVTCNFDGRLVRSGVESDRILETEGSIRRLVCSRHCTDELLPAEGTFRALAAAIKGCEAPADLIPRCPHCGAPLELAIDEARTSHPDAEYREIRQRFADFLHLAHGHRILVLELGVGARNQAIKAPLMRLVAEEPQATYVTFNYSEVSIPRGIAPKSIGISGDLGRAMGRIVPTA